MTKEELLGRIANTLIPLYGPMNPSNSAFRSLESIINEHFTEAEEWREDRRLEVKGQLLTSELLKHKDNIIANLSGRILDVEEENARLRARVEKSNSTVKNIGTDKKFSTPPPVPPPPPSGIQINPIFDCHRLPNQTDPLPEACVDQPRRQMTNRFTGFEPISMKTIFQDMSLRIFSEVYNCRSTLAASEFAAQAIDGTKALFAAWQKEGWA